MADKKVERSGRERPRTPTQKMEAALSDPGTMNVADPTHDKGRSALLDRFRDREERWRREQSLRDQQAAQTVQTHKGAASVQPEAGGLPVEGEAAAETDDA
jgi:hypothetical protein